MAPGALSGMVFTGSGPGTVWLTARVGDTDEHQSVQSEWIGIHDNWVTFRDSRDPITDESVLMTMPQHRIAWIDWNEASD